MTQNEHDERLEDLRWMADGGECATEAARRLGMTRKALENWCLKHARDEWHQLTAREPLPLDPLQAHKLMLQRRRVSA